MTGDASRRDCAPETHTSSTSVMDHFTSIHSNRDTDRVSTCLMTYTHSHTHIHTHTHTHTHTHEYSHSSISSYTCIQQQLLNDAQTCTLTLYQEDTMLVFCHR